MGVENDQSNQPEQPSRETREVDSGPAFTPEFNAFNEVMRTLAQRLKSGLPSKAPKSQAPKPPLIESPQPSPDKS
jgi:hypothetical protein